MIGSKDGSRLTDTGCTYILLNGCTRIGHFDLREFFGRKEHHLFVVFIFEHRTELLVFFHVNRTILMRTG